MTDSPARVAGLLLAAGAGRRMGGPKALVVLGGEPLVQRGVRVLREGGCSPVVVVVGASAELVRPLCAGAEVVEAGDWETGMGASLRAGLAALAGTAPPVGLAPPASRPFDTAPAGRPVDGCVVALVDQPRVTAEAVGRLRAAHSRGAAAAVATYDGRPRNPVLLDRAVWDDVAAAARGDEGARPWLRAHPELVVQVDCSDAGAPDDVDTPEELAALRDGVGPVPVRSGSGRDAAR